MLAASIGGQSALMFTADVHQLRVIPEASGDCSEALSPLYSPLLLRIYLQVTVLSIMSTDY